MVQRAHEENASSFTIFLFGVFKPANLQNHTEAFGKEYAAQNGNQQLHFNDDGNSGYCAAQSKATGIAHENLGRITIVPEEAKACANNGG